jgi:hypothetical protein
MYWCVTVHDILICLLQTEALYMALSSNLLFICTQTVKRSLMWALHILATTKRSSKKLSTGLMQKVMPTEIQVFRDVMLRRRVVTDVSKHRSTVSFRAKQWNNPNLRLIHPGDEPDTVISTCQSPKISNIAVIASNLLAVFASQSSANQQALFAHTPVGLTRLPIYRSKI